MNNQKEVWADVKGYEGIYQVSNIGRVKVFSRLKESKNRNGYFCFKTKEIILKDGGDGCGYRRVVLTKNKIKELNK